MVTQPSIQISPVRRSNDGGLGLAPRSVASRQANSASTHWSDSSSNRRRLLVGEQHKRARRSTRILAARYEGAICRNSSDSKPDIRLEGHTGAHRITASRPEALTLVPKGAARVIVTSIYAHIRIVDAIRFRTMAVCSLLFCSACSLTPAGGQIEAAVTTIADAAISDRRAYNDQKAETLLSLPCDISIGAYFRLTNPVQQEALSMLCSGRRLGEGIPLLR